MAGEYDNNMTGAMFVNDKKTEDKHPDRNGSCEIDGVEYWIAGWIQTSKAGKQFLKLKFTAKEEQEGNSKGGKSGAGSAKSGTGRRQDDGDIPF